MEEQWRPIPAWEMYEVSSHGHIRRGKRVLKLRTNKRTGYPQAVLKDNGRFRTVAPHRLVALVFIGSRPSGMEVRHLDGDKGNSHLDNLVYDTPSINQSDRHAHGTMECAKLTAEQVLEIKERYSAGGVSQYALADEYGVSQRQIGNITQNKQWKVLAKGYS